MPLVTLKVRCALCGAKNDPNAARCRTCTRPISTEGNLASQVMYEDALWSQPITPRRRSIRDIVAVCVVIFLLLASGNYLWGSIGPSWAHLSGQEDRDSTWKPFRGNPLYRVDMPGSPMQIKYQTSEGELDLAQVWINSQWQMVRDNSTVSAVALSAARTDLAATLIAGTVTASPDPRTQTASVVAATIPLGQLSNVVIGERQDPEFGQQFDLTATYTNWPDEAGSGFLRARTISFQGTLYVAITVSEKTDRESLHTRLIEQFLPTSAPEPTP